VDTTTVAVPASDDDATPITARGAIMVSRYVTSSIVRRVTGTGLLIAAVSIPIQIAGGADYPVVPPGLLILAAAAALVLFAPWRWTLILAALATLFIGIGGTVAPNFRHQLSTPGDTVTFAGSITQAIGLVIALAFFVLVLIEAFRRTPRTDTGSLR
jgi:hypothetical protein